MAVGTIEILVTPPFSTASAPAASGMTLYLPRPMNSVRTLSVAIWAISKYDVTFVKVGIPIVLMYAGRKFPWPASAYPHEAHAHAHATITASRAVRRLNHDNINQLSFGDDDR